MLGFFSKKNKEVKGEWLKVSELKVGQQIAVPKEGILNSHNAGLINSREWLGEDDILWDEIESIKHVGTEQVWDIEVEGTRNFIGNNIFAHNTAIFGVGEAGSPSATTIKGAAAAGLNIPGANLTLDASNGTGTGGSGALIFRTAPAAASSSTANTLAERWRIDANGHFLAGTDNSYDIG